MHDKQIDFFDKYSRSLYCFDYDTKTGFAIADMTLNAPASILTDKLINEALDINVCISIVNYHAQLKYDTSLRLALAFRNISPYWGHVYDVIIDNMRDTHGKELANKLRTTLDLIP